MFTSFEQKFHRKRCSKDGYGKKSSLEVAKRDLPFEKRTIFCGSPITCIRLIRTSRRERISVRSVCPLSGTSHFSPFSFHLRFPLISLRCREREFIVVRRSLNMYFPFANAILITCIFHETVKHVLIFRCSARVDTSK